MRKKEINNIFLINFFAIAFINMNQSLIPTIIKKIEMPSFMFGIFLASASIATLIFSPIWGNLSDSNGRKNFLMMGLFVYGLSQLVIVTTESYMLLVLFKFIGGIFMSAYLTSIMAYFVDITPKERRAAFIAYFSAVSTTGTSMGTFIGGYIGDYSIDMAFIIQFLFILFLVVFIKLTIKEKENGLNGILLRHNYKDKFSLNIFKESREISIILICIMMLSFAITNYNSNISYYIESVFKMSPSEIGSILSITGLISLPMNVFVNPFLLKKFNEVLIFRISAFLAGISMLVVSMTDSIFICFVFVFIYLAFANLNMPLQQSIISRISDGKSGKILGMQSSARSVGMIVGSLFTGIVFDVNNKLPFLMCSIVFIVVSLILLFIDLKSDNVDVTSCG